MHQPIVFHNLSTGHPLKYKLSQSHEFYRSSDISVNNVRKDSDIVYRIVGDDGNEMLKIYFVKTSTQEEVLGETTTVSFGCTTNLSPQNRKIRIITIPLNQLGVHILDTVDKVDGKPPLLFQHSYQQDLDTLLVYFVEQQHLKLQQITTTEAIEDSFIIDSTKLGIVMFEFIGAKKLLEFK